MFLYALYILRIGMCWILDDYSVSGIIQRFLLYPVSGQIMTSIWSDNDSYLARFWTITKLALLEKIIGKSN